jgi:PKD repeat protein
VYTAVVTASNSVSSMTATTVVTITDAVIEGLMVVNDSPTPLGNHTRLTATISSGSNVSYTWDFGDSSQETGATVSHVYANLGVYTAVVTASNAINILTATTAVTVTDVPIISLTAVNDSPTPLGNLTTLTATVDGMNNVSYTWEFGDGSQGTGATVAHEYEQIGVYTAVVTATNFTNTLTATTAVTVTDVAIAGLTAVNSSPTELGTATFLTATITAGSNVSYTWDLGDGTVGYGRLLSHTYGLTGTYTAVVTASNSLNTITATTPVVITAPLPAPSFTLYLPFMLDKH